MGQRVAGRTNAPLVEAAIRNVDALNLTPEQEVKLAALHWAHSTGDRMRDVDSELRLILTDRQLRFLLAAESLEQRTAVDEMIESLVDQRIDASINAKLRSQSIVELELAAAVLNRLIGWAKLFAYFVAVPLGLLLLIFALFGLRSFDDVRHAADNVNAVIKESKAEIETSRAELKLNQQRLQENRARLNDISRQFGPAQVKAVRDRLERAQRELEATQAQLRQLVDAAKGGASASRQQLAELQRRLEENRRQITTLGSTVRRLEAAAGLETTGALPSLPIPPAGQKGHRAALLANCAIAEFNQNVREDGGSAQIIEYATALGFPPDVTIPWSGMFIGYCLNKAGVSGQIKPSAANYQMMEMAKRNGLWIPNDGNVRPVPGDIYFIDSSETSGGSFGPMHTGIVWRSFGSDFEGIEGNLKNRLLVSPRSLSTPRLRGFARLRD